MWRFKNSRILLILASTGVLLGGTTAYAPVQPYSPSGGSNYGGGYPSSGAGYGTCGSLKVTEVLDQIYCHHGYYTRFTSTDLAAIKVVLYELGLVQKFAHIQSVLDYVNQAIYFLQDLKEETYKSYDTSELSKYYQNSGYDYSDLKGFIANETTAIQGFEDIRRGYRKSYGMIEWGTFTPDPYASDEYKSTSKRSTRATSLLSLYPTSPARRTRADSEYDYAGDYTCAYISSSYCSANSIVVKNVLFRVLKAVKSLTDGLAILYDYISKHDSCDPFKHKYALLVTADTFGSVLCSASVLLEAAKYEYNIFTSMAGSTGYVNNVYGRSGGSSGGGYSSSYQGFPYAYMYPGPYRYQRAAPLISTIPYAPVVMG